MLKIKWGQLTLSTFVIILIFIANTYGLYREGFIYKYYLASEAEHLVGGFFGAMFISSFYATRKSIYIWVGLLGSLWELFEYSVVHYQPLSELIKNILLIDNFSVYLWDTCLDIFLNFIGTFLYIVRIKNTKEAQ